MSILVFVILLSNGDLRYQKFEYKNFGKNNSEFITKCNEYADKLREEISYHTWNYKNKGRKSQGWYLKNDTGQIIATIC